MASMNDKHGPPPVFVYPDGKPRPNAGNSLRGMQPRNRRGKLAPMPPTGPPLAQVPSHSDTGKYGPLKKKVP